MADQPGLMQKVRSLAGRIAESGGRACFVGGYVRDKLLGRQPKDLDIEVFGLSLERLQELLSGRGRVVLVGRQFGVLRLQGLEVDWSVPRADSTGRHPRVALDPDMSFGEAGRRRDLTMNAMLMDVLTGEVIDPWGGQRDMKNRILRTPDPDRFVEDPLRFFRVMQFAARFEMAPDPVLDNLCRGMDISAVARERVEEEFNKLLLEAARPSLGLRWLDDLGRLDQVLPELVPLKHTRQDPGWHPEGDVWRHTLLVLDAAAALRSTEKGRGLKLMWAALCHDLGKPGTTLEREGRVRSPEHDKQGEILAAALLDRLVSAGDIRTGAVKLVAHHMKPMQFYWNQSSEKAFKRLALRLAPETDLELLADLALADFRGSRPSGERPLRRGSSKVRWFREMAEKSRVSRQPEPPALKGRHLKGIIEPGPEMGKVLEIAYRVQLEEGITDVNVLRRMALEEAGLSKE